MSAQGSPRTLLVAVDFSHCARLALRKARDLLNGKTGRIVALHVIDRDFVKQCVRNCLGDEGQVKKTLFLQSKAELRDLLRGEELDADWVEPVVCEGIPFIEINRKAIESRAEMIVIGSRGKAGKRWIGRAKKGYPWYHLLISILRKLMKAFAYICGESRGNPGPAGFGVVIKDPCGEILATVSRYLGITMKEIAEYRALIAALEEAHDLGLKRIKIYTDSGLLRGQVLCRRPLITKRIAPLHRFARKLMEGVEFWDMICIPTEKNQETRELAKMGIENCKVIQFPVERVGQAGG